MEVMAKFQQVVIQKIIIIDVCMFLI
jgi:hypothetical protein